MLWEKGGKEDWEKESQTAGIVVWPSLWANLEPKSPPGEVLHYASILGRAQSLAGGSLQRGDGQCKCGGR